MKLVLFPLVHSNPFAKVILSFFREKVIIMENWKLVTYFGKWVSRKSALSNAS